jgi:ubiquinone/menaquinone biosynthesis C-methylase UbiE
MRRSSFNLVVAFSLVTAPAIGIAAQQHGQDQRPDHLHHRFDDPERYAKSFDDPARDAWQMPGRVIEALNLQPGDTVADIGAGTGYFTVRLAKAVPKGRVLAVDIEPSMLAYIGKRAAAAGLDNVATVQATGSSPQLPSRADVVLIVDTYHHLPNRVSYFKDLKPSLAPNGRVAIVDFRKDAPDGPPPQFRFEAEQIVAEMQQAGYMVDARHDFLQRQHFLVFRASP